MGMSTQFEVIEPLRSTIEMLPGHTVLEFGTPWCGFCQGAQLSIAEALDDLENVRHMKIEDGKGRPLGRSFQIRLWPTLVFLRDGREVSRVVRPASVEAIRTALRTLAEQA